MLAWLKLSAAFVLLLSLNGCGVYSFTGASIAPDINTVTVSTFANHSQNGSTALSQDLTNRLKDKFISETNLNLVDRGGDIEFKGAITGYNIRGRAPTADETTAINRLTISVRVEYVNKNDEKENWTQSFSRYDDYESSEDLVTVEDELIENINNQLAEDIFNRAFVNW